MRCKLKPRALNSETILILEVHGKQYHLTGLLFWKCIIFEMDTPIKIYQIMDIQAEKLQLIEWLARLNNTTVLQRFISLKKEQEKDWWDQIRVDEKSEIEEGLMQADRGEVTPHKEVMDSIRNGVNLGVD
jgi:hypothetical protein